MVHGLEIFREYFEKHTDQYVLIGGTACDILMGELGVPFRATKDLDMVLIIEAIDVSFGESFWNFIEDGGYEHRMKAEGKDQFFRFTGPSDPSFPKMIELFCKKPNGFELKFDTGLTPIHIHENIVSLSAILLNDNYYELLINGKSIVNGYSLIEIETVVLFKIKAWLDLRERKKAGEQVDSRNIRKHKNDVFRLLINVTPSNQLDIAEEIKADVVEFLSLINDDKPDLKNLGIKGADFKEMLQLIRGIFLIAEDI